MQILRHGITSYLYWVTLWIWGALWRPRRWRTGATISPQNHHPSLKVRPRCDGDLSGECTSAFMCRAAFICGLCRGHYQSSKLCRQVLVNQKYFIWGTLIFVTLHCSCLTKPSVIVSNSSRVGGGRTNRSALPLMWARMLCSSAILQCKGTKNFKNGEQSCIPPPAPTLKRRTLQQRLWRQGQVSGATFPISSPHWYGRTPFSSLKQILKTSLPRLKCNLKELRLWCQNLSWQRLGVFMCHSYRCVTFLRMLICVPMIHEFSLP